MKPIREDSISLGLSLVGIMLLLYLSTFVGFSDFLLIPTILLLSGLVLQMYMKQKIEHDVTLEPHEAKNILLYTLIALVGIGLGSLVSEGLFKPPQPLALSVYDQAMIGSFYAISEERFFRGAFTSFLTWKIKFGMVANVGSGLIFGVYHFAVYGSSPDKIMYVVFAGLILSYVVLKSGRLTPAILAHLGNNLMGI
ncbi:MAG: CPBP family intramembrane metalloprotease [Desulfobacterales bacterium]|nr:CPBP family intramembrane metalloprotease [Desulfobacterales bacterium]